MKVGRGLIKPHVTLFADASIQPKIQSTGWGFWAIGDERRPIQAGGPLKEFKVNSDIVELEALSMGLWYAANKGYFRPTDEWVMLQCDNVGALSLLRGARPNIPESRVKYGAEVVSRRPKRPEEKERVKFILDLADRLNVKLILRHVKGHQDTEKAGRFWVNDVCDRLAKRGARERRMIE